MTSLVVAKNPSESTLTLANVNSASFGLLHTVMVDGKVDAQPLYLAQVPVSGTARNVAFVATEHASVYAIDAEAGTPIWQVSLLANGETPSDTHSCTQVTPEIGVTSTPVIDRTAGPHGALYVVGMSIDKSSNYHQRLHALDITTGAELFNGPAEITGTAPNSTGTTMFAPGQYEERAALLLANGQIYTTWTSHCDIAPYSGWIIAYNQTTLTQTAILNVGPDSGASVPNGTPYNMNGPAIWMSGDGPGADAQGNIYLLTGNGLFEPTLDANGFPNMGDYGNSFLKLASTSSSLNVADYFAMSTEVAESAGDLDLGSGGEMLLPDLTDSSGTVKHLAVGAGKDSNIYVVDRDNMGKFNAAQNQIWQEIDGVVPGNPPGAGSGGVRGSPAWFNGSIYYGDAGGTLKAFSVTNAKLSTAPTSQSAISFAYPGASPVVSASGTTNGIVWAHENTSPAVLHAYDAANLAHELYNSNQAAGGRRPRSIRPWQQVHRANSGRRQSVRRHDQHTRHFRAAPIVSGERMEMGVHLSSRLISVDAVNRPFAGHAQASWRQRRRSGDRSADAASPCSRADRLGRSGLARPFPLAALALPPLPALGSEPLGYPCQQSVHRSGAHR